MQIKWILCTERCSFSAPRDVNYVYKGILKMGKYLVKKRTIQNKYLRKQDSWRRISATLYNIEINIQHGVRLMRLSLWPRLLISATLCDIQTNIKHYWHICIHGIDLLPFKICETLTLTFECDSKSDLMRCAVGLPMYGLLLMPSSNITWLLYEIWGLLKILLVMCATIILADSVLVYKIHGNLWSGS